MWKRRALPRATFNSLLFLLIVILLHLNVATLSGAEARDVASRDQGGGGGGEYEEEEEEEESWEPYSPSMTSEERERAEMKDGWMIMPLPNIEFARIEPGDSCTDVGWSERPRPRRVWDAFMFFNELDVLEVRLNELNSSVHKFVLVEATKTHSGNSKPLHYADSSQRFSAFHDKIVHVVVDDLPVHSNPWVLENFQRNALVRGLVSGGAHPNDLVVISDVDELPAGYILDTLRRCDGASSPTWLYTRFFNFRFEWEFAGQWKHPQVMRVAQLDLGGQGGGKVSPQDVRMGMMREGHTAVEGAGWHVSFFADARGVVDKVKAFTHQELNTEEWLREEAIQHAIDGGIDYFNSNAKGGKKSEPRHGGLHHNPSCAGLPWYILSNAARFTSWLPDCLAAHGDDTDLSALSLPTCASAAAPYHAAR